jgi:hypothetical protein
MRENRSPATAFPADLMIDYVRVSGPELTA